MSNAIVLSQQGNLTFTFSLVMQFIQTCPENIWREKFGGWPVWQQLYHGINATDFFIRPAGTEAASGPAPAAGNLAAPAPGAAPSKEAVKDFAERIKAGADAWLATLDDAALANKHEGASERAGREFTNANILVLLTGHLLYHLGSCDAALRQHGLKGVF